MKRSLIILSLCVVVSHVFPQALDSLLVNESIAVLARASTDSITLRWSSKDFTTWRDGMNKGFVVERYTVVRAGNHISPAEKTMITKSPIYPAPLSAWERLVKENKYAAIAAQAIYGDAFEVDLSKADVVSVVNSATQNEMRFGFAQLSADMLPGVAILSGLWLSDTSIKSDEKYLYRILISDDSLTRRGSIFVGTTDKQVDASPKGLSVESAGRYVGIKWKEQDFPFYAYYVIERSIDSVTFESISHVPTLTLSTAPGVSTKYNYASDSLPGLTGKVYYRVRGVTPFGDIGRASDIVSTIIRNISRGVPFINASESHPDASVTITWDFQDEESSIKGFLVERAQSDKGPYLNLTLQSPLPPGTRTFIDRTPDFVNYYRVNAITKQNTKLSSSPFLVTSVDSIPPHTPKGLSAVVDQYGSMSLKWEKNKDSDVLAYNVYKANHVDEEAFLITPYQINDTLFTERIDLFTLNKKVCYQVVAIDRNQNQSEVSNVLCIQLPDKINPSPPVLLPVQMDSTIKILWKPSSSPDVVRYEVYRSEDDLSQWQRLKIVDRAGDSIYQFSDKTARPSVPYRYTVVAIDSSFNESDKSVAVRGKISFFLVLDQIGWLEPVIEAQSKTVRIRWRYNKNNIREFKIYKSVGDSEKYSLLKSVPGNVFELVDRLPPAKLSSYKIMAVSNDGYKSKFSEQLNIGDR